MEASFQMIAKTLQGLEEILAGELTELGANDIEIGRRMVSFTGNKQLLYRANFSLRTALRVLKPILTFTAKNADTVYDYVKSVQWEKYMDCSKTFAVDSVIFSEEFRHSMFVSYKVKDAIVDYFREKTGDRPNVRINKPDVLINIHIAGNQCTLSLDSSGESLHKRGYRQKAVEAPLSEVLAAGMILMTGWKGETDFIDPMCGSGTIPIEAALIARNISPGVFREGFAFQKWNDYDADMFEYIYNDDSQERPFAHRIYAYDNNPNAIEIARSNIKAAGVAKDIELRQQAIQVFEQPQENALMITNPPYGERISSPDLLQLYHTIGERLKNAFQGNTAWILSCKDECFDEIGLKATKKIPLLNGELECQLREYEIFKGTYKDFREGGERLNKDIRSEEPRKSKSKDYKPREDREREYSEDENHLMEHHIRFQQMERRQAMKLEKEARAKEREKEGEQKRPYRKDGFRQRGFDSYKGRGQGKDGEQRRKPKDFQDRERKPYGKPRSQESYPERKKRERREAQEKNHPSDNQN